MSEERCCGCVSVEQDYDVGQHVGAILITFAVSAAGTLVPIISKKIPACNTKSIVMEAISSFAFGVVLATGLIHMVNEGIQKLSDECLGSIVEEYECLGLAIVLITMILMHFIECEGVVFFGREGSAFHGHDHDHASDVVELTISTRSNSSSPANTNNPYQKKDVEKLAHNGIRRKIATVIFEVGVIFHSLVFFEGVAAFGIAIHSSYSSSSTTALWMQGIFDCVAGGILLYTGLVELLTYKMTTNRKFLSRSTSQRFTLYISMWLGAGLMALIGKWA
ncbi:hypothetical protein PI124_g9931 [Phytophthora idaei]|nr:hypothetical protein PI126_g8781 [Phytophthora idaei]KAG3245318.1 hypothetical protein PI124_g9931 [Phytophthora idaei]